MYAPANEHDNSVDMDHFYFIQKLVRYIKKREKKHFFPKYAAMCCVKANAE